MNARIYILKLIHSELKKATIFGFRKPTWDDLQLLRSFKVRTQQGDDYGWVEFLASLKDNDCLRQHAHRVLDSGGLLFTDWETNQLRVGLPPNVAWSKFDEQSLLQALQPSASEYSLVAHQFAARSSNPDLYSLEHPNHFLQPQRVAQGEVMYIEMKPGLAGYARIGRVTFSNTRRTIYYDGMKLQSLKGSGYKANYFNVESGMWYWVSNCKKDGSDTLYGGIVEIDEDSREEYWIEIRKQPKSVHLTRYRSAGKYSKHRPK